MSGRVDAGERSSVTGGQQMGGFESIALDIAAEVGIGKGSVFLNSSLTLPGFFRPTKKWDLLVIVDAHLVAALEFKSQVGPSFGNNANNRAEEAIGSAVDLWKAYREGAFQASPRPLLGYLFLLEDCPKSTREVRTDESHFPVFAEFRNASYARRYELLLIKLLRERIYDTCCLIRSKSAEMSVNDSLSELSSKRFFLQFKKHLSAFAEEMG